MAEAERGDVERPRLWEAERAQMRWEAVDLEAAVPPAHRARVIWATVEQLDLTCFYDEIAARGSVAGRPAIDPKILLTLWLYAISEAIGSARHLARLCTRDDVYRWICGGVAPNHHTLSDFRVAHGPKLDALLTEVLAALMSAGVLRLRRVAQDGVRVRAHAGTGSFRRGPKLERYLGEAEAQIAALHAELTADGGAATARERAAQERAARERATRLRRALAELPKVQRVRERNATREGRAHRVARGAREVRVSTTDPEARVMRMADGSYRPAVNMQFASDTETRLIVGVGVSNAGTDRGELLPMLEQVAARTAGAGPAEYLVDGGYTNLAAIDAAEARGVTVYAPVATPRRAGIDPHARKPDDTDRTAGWRARMATADAQRIYAERAATAETFHADQRTWRGLRQLPVRGLAKVWCIGLWAALLHNILRADVLFRGGVGT
jgi:transposase/ribosomal protein L34